MSVIAGAAGGGGFDGGGDGGMFGAVVSCQYHPYSMTNTIGIACCSSSMSKRASVSSQYHSRKRAVRDLATYPRAIR